MQSIWYLVLLSQICRIDSVRSVYTHTWFAVQLSEGLCLLECGTVTADTHPWSLRSAPLADTPQAAPALQKTMVSDDAYLCNVYVSCLSARRTCHACHRRRAMESCSGVFVGGVCCLLRSTSSQSAE